MLNMIFSPKRASSFEPTHPFWYNQAGRRTTSGERVSEDRALRYSGCWAATNKIASSIAALPLQLHVVDSNGKRQKHRRSKLWWILHNEPNPDQDSFTFWEMMISWWVNWGNAFAEIEREDDDPESPIRALWPIHPSRVSYTQAQDGTLAYHVADNRGGANDLQAWEMFNIVGHLSHDGIRGRGVIDFACESLGIGLAIERHQGSFFGNGTALSGVLSHPGKPGKDARESMRREWRQTHSRNAGDHYRIAVLWEGVSFTPTQSNPEDTQMIESATFRITDMARVYDLPPHVLKELSRATFSNIDSQQISLVVDSFLPRIKRMERAIDRQLLTRKQKTRGFYSKFVVDGLLRGDPLKRAQVNKIKFMHGNLTINEWLEQDEKNPIDDPIGNARFVPANLVEASRALNDPVDEPDAAIQPQRGGFGGEDNDESLEQRREQLGQHLVEALVPLIGDQTEQLSRLQQESLARLQQIATTQREEGCEPEGDAQQIAEQWLAAVMRDVLAAEAKRAIKAASEPAKFLTWLDRQYEPKRFAEYLRAAREPLAALQVAFDQFVQKHVEQSRLDLLAAADGPRESFSDRIEVTVQQWPRRTECLNESRS